MPGRGREAPFRGEVFDLKDRGRCTRIAYTPLSEPPRQRARVDVAWIKNTTAAKSST